MGTIGETDKGAPPHRRGGFGLSYRMAVASGMLALLTTFTFVFLYGTITNLRNATNRADRTQMLLVTGNRLERLMVDMETGQRGFALTGDARYLQPWQAAARDYPAQVRLMRRSAGTDRTAAALQVPGLVRATDAYVSEYSAPAMAEEKRDPRRASSPQMIALGKQQLDTLRQRFDALTDTARTQAIADQVRALEASRRATLTSAGAALASFLLIVTFAAYLRRSIVRPIRRAAAMAEGLAGGDMRVRMAESSPAEIGTLAVTFNAMAGSLEANERALRRAAAEQAAFRRVATLVARAVPLTEVFQVATTELGRILDADLVLIDRVEADRTRTVVGSWRRPGTRGPAPGTRLPYDGGAPEASVLATGLPVRWPATGTIGIAGAAADGEPENGIAGAAADGEPGNGIAGPVMVGDRRWGTISCRSGRPVSPGAEERLSQLAGLVGTAIANEESRAALVAARARLVAASDQTRRQIERDLHDGVQQRLVSLGLELRAAEAAVPPDRPALRRRISGVARGLLGALEDLREISRGLHPVVLSRAGLEPALRALARRSPLPVQLDVRTGRLDEAVEAAAYYVVSEALTNAIKHARASCVRVTIRAGCDVVDLAVHDDGVGGAGTHGGSGLIGLRDRAEALGGTLLIDSPPGGGTRIEARIPVARMVQPDGAPAEPSGHPSPGP